MNTKIENLVEEINVLQGKLIDAKVDMNIKDERIRVLEKELRVAQFAVRELEIGTMTMQTLSLQEEEEDFDPRQTGTFSSDAWKRTR
jgi:hypothetical protein